MTALQCHQPHAPEAHTAAEWRRERFSLNLSAVISTFRISKRQTVDWYEMQRQQRAHRGERDSLLGPVGPACSALEVYAAGDDAKRACGLSQLRAPCHVASVGSNGQWAFEKDVVARTRCHIDTFDCTVSKNKRLVAEQRAQPPRSIRHRVTLHDKCVGKRAVATTAAGLGPIVNLSTLLATRGGGLGETSSKSSLLKMDAEGSEYEVLGRMGAAELAALPPQIALELHFKSAALPRSQLRASADLAAALEYALLVDHMWRAGGFTLQHLRESFGGATELLLRRSARAERRLQQQAEDDPCDARRQGLVRLLRQLQRNPRRAHSLRAECAVLTNVIPLSLPPPPLKKVLREISLHRRVRALPKPRESAQSHPLSLHKIGLSLLAMLSSACVGALLLLRYTVWSDL